MRESDLFSALADKRERSLLTVRHSLADFTGGILLTICVLLTALFPLVALRLVNPFSPDFFVNTAYTCCSSYLAYLLFFPEGKRTESARNRLFIAGEERLLSLSHPIRAEHLPAFLRFCEKKTLWELSERRKRFLAAHGYREEEVDGCSPAEARRRLRLTRRAARLRPHPIEPSLILCKEGRAPLCDVGRPRLSYGARAALLRPPFLLLGSLLLSSIAILPGGPLDFAALVKILSGVFGVTMAAFSGYSAGCSHIRWESGQNERRVLFLSSFYQEEGITAPKEET